MWQSFHAQDLNLSFSAVVPKHFRAVTQIEVAIGSYYPQYLAVIAHDMEQNCGFGSAVPPKNRILPLGGDLPPVWEPLVQRNKQAILRRNKSVKRILLFQVFHRSTKKVEISVVQAVCYCKRNNTRVAANV